MQAAAVVVQEQLVEQVALVVVVQEVFTQQEQLMEQ
jgi:hypothetical protein